MSPATPPVILTRAPEDNAPLAARLRERGLVVLEWPALATRVLDLAGGARALLEAVAASDVVVLTSRRGLEAAEEIAGDPRALATALAARRLAAVGPATAQALRERGLAPAITAPGTGSADLARDLVAACPRGCRLALLRSAAADDVLPSILREAGLIVDDRRLYEPAEPVRPSAQPMPVAAVACASPSAARVLLSWHPWLARAPFVAIGPTTARALAQLGVERITLASGSDVRSLEEAVLALAREEPAGAPTA